MPRGDMRAQSIVCAPKIKRDNHEDFAASDVARGCRVAGYQVYGRSMLLRRRLEVADALGENGCHEQTHPNRNGPQGEFNTRHLLAIHLC